MYERILYYLITVNCDAVVHAITIHVYIYIYIHTHTCSNHVPRLSPIRVLLRDLCGRRSYNNAHTREKPGNEVSCKEQCRCTCTMCIPAARLLMIPLYASCFFS